MNKYQESLPTRKSRPFLTDGGLETTLVFHEGIELPEFAAFDLMKNATGRRVLRNYYSLYAAMANRYHAGFVLESPTWRSNRDWGKKIGYDAKGLETANRDSIALMHEIGAMFESAHSTMVVSGCIGPRGDGYQPDHMMNVEEAKAYHHEQIAIFKDSGADMVSAMTLNTIAEGAGIALAAKECGMPAAISFTVETDGRLPTGHSLREAIEEVDRISERSPIYYMINCAHPVHFEGVLDGGEWMERLGGIRANSSIKSHAELNESTELDEGDPADLGRRVGTLRRLMKNMAVVGGCCGTDHRHVEAMGRECLQ